MSQQTFKQQLLKLAYPVLMRITKLAGTNATIRKNKDGKKAPASVYQLTIARNNGQPLPLEQLRGRKILLVNTASECGYTGQYEELQELWQAHKDRLEIIGFPANDFKEQEKGSDADIEQFCKINYGVQFPLAKKSQVVPGAGQHPVFQWLTNPGQNGWNNQAPQWNFAKYLINEEGVLTHYFGPSVSPLDKEVVAAIQQ
ncbi:glutathione peroxidase [Cnuella takakiae]|nr:glutathione peroxidase [Cnuella takakiae]OLY94656.1 glutathione peroxidase [Cnuella takakiae]